ncbi:MAG: hypothetical protein AABW79_04170 [Nanoarchaeota archaeon]
MTKERLDDYPTLVDPALDFEATRMYFGRGSCNYDISEVLLDNGQVVVCLHQQRESDEVIHTSEGFRNVCEQGIVVSGYLVKPEGFFSWFRSSKVRRVQDEEMDNVRSELMEKLKHPRLAFFEF